VEDWRVTSRHRLAWIIAPLTLPIVLAGCSDAFNAGPMSYVESERLTTDLKEPKLQGAVRTAMLDLFGKDPRNMKAPPGSGLPGGGYRLASHFVDPVVGKLAVHTWKPESGDPKAHAVPQVGGYGLYRLHCLHCHGVSGAGDGPTAPFLYPRPRDYRRGIFKFTSTATGQKPTRADLRKTIANGLHGTSMPAFDALMAPHEIEQVVDYMTFLSLRGETELALIDEAAASAELPADVVADVSRSVFNKWKQADGQVMNPPIPKPPSSRESVLRGRELFLGLNKTGNRVDCTSCHGPQAVGNGPSFVSQEVFNEVVFGGDPSAMDARLATHDEKTRKLWKDSLDDWGMPLRPNNLNRGVYKGGRRPIDIYWRIAKGINGAKMPAHYPTIEPEKIWDLVNFVLALPEDKSLLEGATLPSAPPPPLPKPAVATR
jgi:mono/diheme cytochrome c family protein